MSWLDEVGRANRAECDTYKPLDNEGQLRFAVSMIEDVRKEDPELVREFLRKNLTRGRT